MATLNVTADSGDASVTGGGNSIANAHAAAGTFRSSTATTDSLPQFDNRSDFTNYVFYRHLVAFDTSSLTAGASVTAGSLSIHLTGVGANPTTISLVQLSGTGAPTFVAGDYAKVTLTRMASDLSCTGAGTYTFTLNSSGLAQVNKTGWTTFAIVDGNDYSGSAISPNSPPFANASYVSMDTANNATSGNRPALSLTYTLAGGVVLPSAFLRRQSGLYTR